MAYYQTTVPVPVVEKLKGAENYSTWKFLMKMILIQEDLWDVVEKEVKDEKRSQKALARICLSVLPLAFTHVRNAKNAYEAWQNLARAYENEGLCTA